MTDFSPLEARGIFPSVTLLSGCLPRFYVPVLDSGCFCFTGQVLVCFVLFYFLFKYLFTYSERERAQARAGQGQREARAVSTEPFVGLGVMTREVLT